MESAKLKRKVVRNYADRRLCVCGHTFGSHRFSDPSLIGNVCCVPDESGPLICVWHKLQLDNLAYVEQLARERNLI
jgi:hypothetical protein